MASLIACLMTYFAVSFTAALLPTNDWLARNHAQIGLLQECPNSNTGVSDLSPLGGRADARNTVINEDKTEITWPQSIYPRFLDVVLIRTEI